MGGVLVAVFVAVAYDLVGSCAGTAPDGGEVVPETSVGALSWLGAVGGIALFISEAGEGVRAREYSTGRYATLKERGAMHSNFESERRGD